MKTKNYLFVLLLLCTLFSKAQTPVVHNNPLQDVFANLDKTKIPHGLLLDAAVEFANLKKYDGTLPAKQL